MLWVGVGVGAVSRGRAAMSLAHAAVLLSAAASQPGSATTSEATFNGVRVQALSPTLLRIEPAGPTGFVNGSTFAVVSRESFGGVPLRATASNTTHITLATEFYTVEVAVPRPPPSPPPATPLPGAAECAAHVGFAVQGFSGYPAHRISSCGARARSCLPPGATAADCCRNCTAATECLAWGFAEDSCLLYARGHSFGAKAGSVAGGLATPGLGPTTGIAASVSSPSGALLWSATDLGTVSEQLSWPGPANGTAAYAFKDFPRFGVPAWGAAPIPADARSTLDPALLPSNGYDFRINTNGDVYVFLLGDSLDTWWSARREFVRLTGPTPVLPEWAFGIWFTWWHAYTEAEAKAEILRWRTDKLPLDVGAQTLSSFFGAFGAWLAALSDSASSR